MVGGERGERVYEPMPGLISEVPYALILHWGLMLFCLLPISDWFLLIHWEIILESIGSRLSIMGSGSAGPLAMVVAFPQGASI